MTQQQAEGGIIPTVIPATPIPILNTTNSNSQPGTPDVSNTGGDVLTPTTIGNQPITDPTIATDVIGTALDTQSKKILGSFTFGQVGALKIGSFQQGVSGEVDITPSGITAKNLNGSTTFTLDGTTGNATFAGTITTGAVVAGTVNVGANNIILDGTNKRIVINDGTNDRVLIGFQSGGF